MQGKRIEFGIYSTNTGIVELVYDDVIKEGTEPGTRTMLLVSVEGGKIEKVAPALVTRIFQSPSVVTIVDICDKGTQVIARTQEQDNQEEFEAWAAKTHWVWRVAKNMWFSHMEGFKTEDELKEIFRRYNEGKLV